MQKHKTRDDRMLAVCNAMAIAACGQRWRGSTGLHPPALEKAWDSAWGMSTPDRAFMPSEFWDESMARLYPDEIARFDTLSAPELMALFKIMSPESGQAFYCAVMALANKIVDGLNLDAICSGPEYAGPKTSRHLTQGARYD